MNTPYRIRQLTLLSADIVIFAVSLYIALCIRTTSIPSFDVYLAHSVFIYIFGIWTLANYINGLYDFRGFASDTPLNRRTIETWFISIVLGIIFFYIYPENTIQPKTLLILTATIGYISAYALRIYITHVYQTRSHLSTPVLFVGWNADTAHISQRLTVQTQHGLRPVALCTTQDVDQTIRLSLEQYDLTHKIRSIVSNHEIGMVVVTPEELKNPDITAELYQLLFWDVKIIDSISLFEQITGSLPTSAFSEGWFLRHIGTSTQYVYQKWQRAVDVFGALLIGSITVILLPFIALGIKLTSRGPVFFTQKRIGKHGIPFTLYKFRSMYTLSPDGSAEQNGFEFSKKGDVRITSFGKFLRRFRIDELPQTFNLIRGDISLIGPRPERPEIVEELTKIMPYYPLRHVVKPGLTGWAVLHQNYTDTIETSLEKLQYDLYYIKNKSVLLDVSIILKTFRLLLRAMGQ